MHNLILSPVDPAILARDIAKEVTDSVLKSLKGNTTPPAPDPLDDFIPKAEVRDKIASSSTLWHMEKEGRIKLYSFRGKRFYKRSELLEAFDEVKTKKAEL